MQPWALPYVSKIRPFPIGVKSDRPRIWSKNMSDGPNGYINTDTRGRAMERNKNPLLYELPPPPALRGYPDHTAYPPIPPRSHARKTSWSPASSEPQLPSSMYMHGNFTVGNVSNSDRLNSRNMSPPRTSVASRNTSPRSSFVANGTALDRRSRMERVYGGNRQPANRPNLPPLDPHFTEGAPPLPRSTVESAQPPPRPQRQNYRNLPPLNTSQRGSVASNYSHDSMLNLESPSQISDPSPSPISHPGGAPYSSRTSGLNKFTSKLAISESQSQPNLSQGYSGASGPNRATNSTHVPAAKYSSMPSSATSTTSPYGSFPSSLSSTGSASQENSPTKGSTKHSRSTQNNSRSSSPAAFFSRISSRISSGFSSRISSRISSRMSSRGGSSMSYHASSGLNGSSSLGEAKPAIMDLVLEDDDWPEYFPRRAPHSTVVEQVMYLADSGMPISDLDMNAKYTPKASQELPLTEPDAIEAKGFAPRGLFYYTEHSGVTDEEGNYRHVNGEQIGFRYSVADVLGKGSFGTVLRCRDHKSGRMVAVKVTARKPELHSQVKIEASLLRALLVDHQGHPDSNHFVRYIEHFKFRGHMCIATELLGPNLYEVIKRNGFRGLKETTVRYIARQLCEGLEFLSSQKIIHCDIKPENILLSDLAKCQIKIIDFGSGCYEGKRLYTYIQSRFYRAPEILLGMPYGAPIDMWSLGAIIPELLLGRPLFPSVDEPDQIVLMTQVLGPPDQSVMWKSSRAALFFDPFGNPLNLQNSKGTLRGPPASTPLRQLLSSFSEEAIDFCERTLRWAPEARLKADKAVYHAFVLGQ